MTMKPDFTPTQVDALPIGPDVRRRREATREEIRKGSAYYIEWAERRAVIHHPIKEGDVIAHYDSAGRLWFVGQWEGGEWFKEDATFG